MKVDRYLNSDRLMADGVPTVKAAAEKIGDCLHQKHGVEDLPLVSIERALLADGIQGDGLGRLCVERLVDEVACGRFKAAESNLRALPELLRCWLPPAKVKADLKNVDVTLDNERVFLSVDRYCNNDRLAVTAYSAETGEPVCHLTTNLPEHPLGPDQFFVRRHSDGGADFRLALTLAEAGLIRRRTDLDPPGGEAEYASAWEVADATT